MVFDSNDAIPWWDRWFVPSPSNGIDIRGVICYANPKVSYDKLWKKCAAMAYVDSLGLPVFDPDDERRVHPFCKEVAGL